MPDIARTQKLGRVCLGCQEYRLPHEFIVRGSVSVLCNPCTTQPTKKVAHATP